MGCVEIGFLGTGSSSHPRRMQASIILLHDNITIAVDYGCGAHNNAYRVGVDPRDIDLYIFTHAHYDHLCGLPMSVFTASFKTTARFRMIADNVSWEILKRASRAALRAGGPYSVELERVASPPLEGETVSPGIKVDMPPARHSITGFHVKVTLDDITVLVSGDTAPSQYIMDHAGNVDVLVHEATLPMSVPLELEGITGHTRVDTAIRLAGMPGRGFIYHLSEDSEDDALAMLGRARGVELPDDGRTYRIC